MPDEDSTAPSTREALGRYISLALGQCSFSYISHIIILFCTVFFSDTKVSTVVLLWWITSTSLYAIGTTLRIIGGFKYCNTFSNKTIALPVSVNLVFLYVPMPAFIYAQHIAFPNKGIYTWITLCTLAATAYYYTLCVKHAIRENLSKLYFNINNKLFFDQQNYILFCLNRIPLIHYVICMGISAVAGAFMIDARSFHSRGSSTAGLGIVSLGLAFVAYPIFIYGVYMLFAVHPKVEKKFNQPVLSDRWRLIAQRPDLAEKLWGPDPVKRPIQYEEVFPQRKSG